MDFSLSPEEKLSVYRLTKKSFEKDLIQRLCAIGFDPESFDPNSFVPEEDKTAQFYIKELILKIKKVEEKILEFDKIVNLEKE